MLRVRLCPAMLTDALCCALSAHCGHSCATKSGAEATRRVLRHQRRIFIQGSSGYFDSTPGQTAVGHWPTYVVDRRVARDKMCALAERWITASAALWREC